ncbi:DgyrCDS9350 [Dimorphilus gyrociliatus]|uniref:DgyrCDS9350 n=1 Tax=Dimorphilus gyrociliatus TaxID=2664684 RepID=A0A7I8VX27_9ANNE|nr:DgyrCDS9350 [Dimorphilus gyrociliatus]
MYRAFVLFSFFASFLLFQSAYAQFLLTLYSFLLLSNKEEEAERAENPADLILGKVEVYVEEAILKLGQNTRLICITKFKKKPDTDITSIWLKKAYDSDINETETASLTLGPTLINEYYQPRYSVKINEDNKNNMYTRNYTLSIVNASVADSGLFVCLHQIGTKRFSGNHSVLVNKVIGTSWNTSAYDQTANRSLVEEGSLDAKASETYDLECSVRHTSNLHVYNRADVYISGTKESKKTNVSSLFIRTNASRSSTDENYIKTAVDGAKFEKDPLIQLYDTSLRNKKFKFNYTHNGQYLHCFGANDKSGAGSKDAVIRLNITHAPAFKCDHVQKASLHATNNAIKCKVYANPMIAKEMYWEFSYGGDKSKLRPGQHKGKHDYRITAGIKKKTNEYVEFSLHFAKIRQEYFKDYKLVAKNSEGEKSVKIRLQQKTSPRGAASQTTAQFSMLSILFVVARIFSKA